MPTIKDFTKTKQTITLIYGFTTPYASDLAQLFLNENGKVIVIDEINAKVKKLAHPFLKNPNFLLVSNKSLTKLLDSFLRIDYIYIFLDNIIAGSDYPHLLKTKLNYLALTNKDFTEISNHIDILIKLAIEFASKLTITLPYYLNTLIAPHNKYNLKLFENTRDLFFDYFNQTAFNGRIVYIPEIVGNKYDYSLASIKNFLVRQVVTSKSIQIPGDGLLKLNLIPHSDVVKALLFTSFSPKATGKEILLEPQTLTILNFLYTVLELTKNEKKLEFKDLPKEIIKNQKQAEKYLPKQLITSKDLGYTLQEPLNTAIQQTLSTTNTLLKGDWQATDQEEPKTVTIQTNKKHNEILPHFGQKYKEFDNPIEKYFWYTLWQLFNIFIKTPVDFIYKLLTTSNSNLLKILGTNLLLLLTTYIIALFLTPYVILFNKLQNLTPQNPVVFEQQLDTLEQNLYNISYLSQTKLSQQLTYLQEIIKTYQELLQKQTQAQELYQNYITFINNLFENNSVNTLNNQAYLEKIQANPYIISNILNQLNIYTQKTEQLEPKFNTIFESTLLKQKTTLVQQAKQTANKITTLQTIYPYTPYFAGLHNTTTYSLLITDSSKPSILGGYPLGIFNVSVSKGYITQHSYITLNKTQQEQLYNAKNFDTVQKLLYTILPKTADKSQNTIIATVNSEYLISALDLTHNIYIPTQGEITSSSITQILNNFTNLVKQPFTQQELINALYNKIKTLPANQKLQLINNLLQTNTQNWLILNTPQTLAGFFDTQHTFINPKLLKDKSTLTISAYDTTSVLNLDYTNIVPTTNIIIDAYNHNIVINYTYSGNTNFTGYKNILLLGNIQTIQSKNNLDVSLPYLKENIHYTPNTNYLGFVKFSYKHANQIYIINPLNHQELYIHLINPEKQQLEQLKQYGTLTNTVDNTYIFKIESQTTLIKL